MVPDVGKEQKGKLPPMSSAKATKDALELEQLRLAIADAKTPFNRTFWSNLTIALLSVIVAVGSLILQQRSEATTTHEHDEVFRHQVFAEELQHLGDEHAQSRASAAVALREFVVGQPEESDAAISALISALGAEREATVVDQISATLLKLGPPVIPLIAEDERRTVDRLAIGGGEYIGARLALNRLQRCQHDPKCLTLSYASQYAWSPGTRKVGVSVLIDNVLRALNYRASARSFELARSYGSATCPLPSSGIYPQDFWSAFQWRDGKFKEVFQREMEVEFDIGITRTELEADARNALHDFDQEARHLGADSTVLTNLLKISRTTAIDGIDLHQTFIVGAELCGVRIDNSNFSGSYVSGNAANATFSSDDFASADLSHLHLRQARIVGGSVADVQLASCSEDPYEKNRGFDESFVPDYTLERPSFAKIDWRRSATAREPYSKCKDDARRYLERNHN
jgi:hypothetical protein